MSGPLPLGNALLRGTSLSEEELELALRKQGVSGQRLTEVLLELGLVSETELLRSLGEIYDIPLRDGLVADEVDGELATRLPIAFAKQHHMLPIKREGDRMEIAIADPLMTEPLEERRDPQLLPNLSMTLVRVPVA